MKSAGPSVADPSARGVDVQRALAPFVRSSARSSRTQLPVIGLHQASQHRGSKATGGSLVTGLVDVPRAAGPAGEAWKLPLGVTSEPGLQSKQDPVGLGREGTAPQARGACTRSPAARSGKQSRSAQRGAGCPWQRKSAARGARCKHREPTAGRQCRSALPGLPRPPPQGPLAPALPPAARCPLSHRGGAGKWRTAPLHRTLSRRAEPPEGPAHRAPSGGGSGLRGSLRPLPAQALRPPRPAGSPEGSGPRPSQVLLPGVFRPPLSHCLPEDPSLSARPPCSVSFRARRLPHRCACQPRPLPLARRCGRGRAALPLPPTPAWPPMSGFG